MDELKGKRICIIADDGFEDSEMIYPLIRLKYEAGANVHIAGLKKGSKITGKYGIPVMVDTTFKEVKAANFDALIIPGGSSPDHIRIYPEVTRIVQEFNRANKVIASICHGIQVLITAKVLKGKKATGYKSLIVDIENSGARYEDKPLVVDKNYIFSRMPSDLGHFCDAILKAMLVKPVKAKASAGVKAILKPGGAARPASGAVMLAAAKKASSRKK